MATYCPIPALQAKDETMRRAPCRLGSRSATSTVHISTIPRAPGSFAGRAALSSPQSRTGWLKRTWCCVIGCSSCTQTLRTCLMSSCTTMHARWRGASSLEVHATISMHGYVTTATGMSTASTSKVTQPRTWCAEGESGGASSPHVEQVAG